MCYTTLTLNFPLPHNPSRYSMSQIEHTLRMATLEAKEKELRTIVTDGFVSMETQFSEVRNQLNAHEEQIDTLAIEVQSLRSEMNQRFDKLEKKMDNKLDTVHGKLDLILNALALT